MLRIYTNIADEATKIARLSRFARPFRSRAWEVLK